MFILLISLVLEFLIIQQRSVGIHLNTWSNCCKCLWLSGFVLHRGYYHGNVHIHNVIIHYMLCVCVHRHGYKFHGSTLTLMRKKVTSNLNTALALTLTHTHTERQSEWLCVCVCVCVSVWVCEWVCEWERDRWGVIYIYPQTELNLPQCKCRWIWRTKPQLSNVLFIASQRCSQVLFFCKSKSGLWSHVQVRCLHACIYYHTMSALISCLVHDHCKHAIATQYGKKQV